MRFSQGSRLASCALAAVLAALPGMALAQATIVRSSGPSAAANKVGSKLPEGAKIKLDTNDRVTVLGKSGTRVFVGPGTFVVGSNSSTQPRTRMADFVSRKGALARVRAGAVRGPDQDDSTVPMAAPGVWLLEPESEGRFCYNTTGRLIVWRALSDTPGVAKITAPGWSYLVDLAWDTKSRIKAWPADEAPLDDGAVYSITAPEGGDPHQITIVRLDNPPDDAEALFGVLMEKGCTAQAERMADEAEASGEAEE